MRTQLSLLPEDEGIVPLFYRTLRNAAIVVRRRRYTANRALEVFAHELDAHAAPDAELDPDVCECITRLARSLKPEYAEALQAIDIDGVPVKTFAERHGLSAGNAGVRIFRARAALKKPLVETCGTCVDHGCRDCTCRA